MELGCPLPWLRLSSHKPGCSPSHLTHLLEPRSWPPFPAQRWAWVSPLPVTVSLMSRHPIVGMMPGLGGFGSSQGPSPQGDPRAPVWSQLPPRPVACCPPARGLSWVAELLDSLHTRAMRWTLRVPSCSPSSPQSGPVALEQELLCPRGLAVGFGAWWAGSRGGSDVVE